MNSPSNGADIENRCAWGRLARVLGSLWSGLLFLAVIAACSSSPTSTPVPAAPEVDAVFVTTDIAVGSNRVVFGLVDRNGMPVRAAEAQVRAIYLPSGQDTGEVRATATARFFQWPAGAQGIFKVNLELDTSGVWQLEVDVTTDDGTPVTGKGKLMVRPQSITAAIGSRPPASSTLTLDDVDDVDDLSTITSSTDPDPDLYRLSVGQGLKAGKPLVVVFATPAFCVTATCGPQVEIVSSLKDRFADEANFIHVEVFSNPHEIEADRPSGGFVEAVVEWSLPTEPWVFIMDKNGLVAAKFEGFTTAEELEAALREVVTG
ncbi:MAG: hypothetical protein QF659_02635 [Dehalococcoidia bacterium]|nr:hypothetical protein [Dehalococcoidia bacterium]